VRDLEYWADMSIRKALAIGFVGLCLNGVVLGPWAWSSAIRETAGDLAHFGDFTHFYIGACLAGTEAEYDASAVLRLQQSVTGIVQPHLLPTRLPFYYRLLRPLCGLSYLSAHRIWMILLVTTAVAGIGLLSLTQGAAAVAASLWSAPLFLSLVGGQDDTILYLVLAAGLWLRQAGRPRSAGVVLSLLWIKFHLFLLLPVLFVVKREYRLLAGAAFGSALLLGACFAVAGIHWPARYAALLLNPVISPGGDLMPNLHGVALHFAGSAAIEAALAILVVAAAVWVMARTGFALAFGAALLGGILVSHHAYPADCVFLVPGLVDIWRQGRSPAREIALICLLPIPYWFAEFLGYGWLPATLLLAALIALARRAYRLARAD
jgi:hypothetical protein